MKKLSMLLLFIIFFNSCTYYGNLFKVRKNNNNLNQYYLIYTSFDNYSLDIKEDLFVYTFYDSCGKIILVCNTTKEDEIFLLCNTSNKILER